MGQITLICSGLNSSPTTTANTTTYQMIQAASGNVWVNSGAEGNVKVPIPIPGTFDYLRMKLATAPGGSGSWTFTVRKNAADTTLTTTISGAATTGSDTVDSFSVVAGDLVDFKALSGATAPASSDVKYAVRFTANNTNQSMILAGTPNSFTAGSTQFMGIQSDTSIAGTEANLESVMPTAGTLKNLYVNLTASPGTGKTVTVTVVQNGIATAVAASVSGTNTTGNDTTHSITIAAGDTLSYQITSTAASSVARVLCGIEFDPTTDGESVQLFSSVNTLAQNLNEFNSSSGGSSAWTATETNRSVLAIANTTQKFYVQCTGIASGQTYTTLIRKNLATPSNGSNVVITGTATTGNDTTHTIAVADDDVIDINGHTSATSGTVTPGSGFVMFVATPSTTNPAQYMPNIEQPYQDVIKMIGY